jgi:hypothetical protein
MLASTFEVLLFENPNTGTKYVQVQWNGEVIPIRDCGQMCELENFISLLDVYLELGGDLKELCS